MSIRVGSGLNFKKVAATPGESAASDEVIAYVKSDGKVYAKDSTGVERAMLDVRTVRVSSTGALTLSGTQTVDGVALGVGDRVLVRHQGVYSGNNYDNGVWVVASGAWTRAGDADTSAKLAGQRWMPTEGTKFTGFIFLCAFASTDTLGTTALAFVAENAQDYGNIFEIPTGNTRSRGETFVDLVNTRLPRYWSGTAWVYPKGVQDYSSAAPSNPVTGELWYDSGNNLLKVYNGTSFVATGISDALPIGTVTSFAGVTPPAGCLMADGSSYLRTTYPDLFTAITTTVVGSGASGQAVITTTDTSKLAVGYQVESAVTGIPFGSTILSIVANTSFTISANLTATLTNATVRAIPHGAVDATHFNVPDGSGRSPLGTGTPAGANGATAHILGQKGGEETHVLTTPEIPGHTHGFSGTATSGFYNGGTATAGTNAQRQTGATGDNTSSTGGGGAHNVLHPFVVLNAIIKATVVSSNFAIAVQSTAPTSPVVGQQYQNTTDGIVRVYDGTTWDLVDGHGTEWVSTTPAAPATGIVPFTRFRARRIPSFIGPSGQDSQLQPAFFSNRISMFEAVDNSTTISVYGLAATILNNAGAAATAVASAPTNFFTSMLRFRVASTTTAGTAGEVRSTTAPYHLSSTANKGGFFFVARFGFNLIAAGSRAFIGFTTFTTAFPAGADPSASLNMIGFGFDAADANIQFMRNDGTGTATKVDMGANFAKGTGGTNFYEARIFVPSGNGQQVYYSIQRLNDGAITNSGSTPITTDLPAVDTGMGWHLFVGNGAVAAAHSMDLQALYVETDN